jgi:hypothetical protein
VDVAEGDGKDRVVCEPGGGDRVIADAGDRLDPGCTRERPGTRSGQAPIARTAQTSPIEGDGTNDTPFTIPPNSRGCQGYDTTSFEVNCFPARTLEHLWDNEFVPAYQCPGDHPYLSSTNYAPVGTKLINGVSVIGLGPIGMSISGALSQVAPGGLWAVGPRTGYPNSSVTNWEISANSYQVILHCEPDTANSWIV